MTARNSFKRRIRTRMTESGESYSTARQAILNAERNASSPAERLTVVLAQPASRTGDMGEDLYRLFNEESVPRCDVLVLPELIGAKDEGQKYLKSICDLAKDHQCHFVGGSRYVNRNGMQVNAGVVANERGKIIATYEKMRPYGSEIHTGVSGGNTVGKFTIRGRIFAVLICSDLWFSETFSTLDYHPDALLIPSFSITQRDDPTKPRELWEHMLVARAYEYTAYVGVCDWSRDCRFDDGLSAVGVSGFANPRPDGGGYYSGNGDSRFRSYELDFSRLDAFRENRAGRGFLASKPA